MASRPSPASRFSPEERIGLGVAIAAHVLLFGWLALDGPRRDLVPPPDRMTVSFADEVAPQSTAPEPMVQAAPEVAPTRGETVSEPEPEPEPLPVARPEPQPLPRVIPTPQPRLVPRPVPTRVPPKPAPVVKAIAKPVPKPAPKVAAKPVAKPSTAAKPAAKSAPADERIRRRPDAPKGASRLGNDFLKGLPGGQAAGTATTPPAAKAGPQVAASLSQAIARQLKPRWVAPQGAEADQLVTILAWDLNRDGSLAGRPRVVSQSGVTDANRTQQARHAEQAIRAVQLAAPFDLPEQYYDSWKRVASFRFDRKLSQ